MTKYFFLFFLCIAIINISYSFFNYKKLISQEIQHDKFKVKNIYPKKNYFILKLYNNNITFWTSMNKNEQNITIGDVVSTYFLTNQIDFISYNKGFYAKSFDTVKQQKQQNIFDDIKLYIQNQHKNDMTKELYSAIFLSTAISKSVREVCVDFGVSHLVAISGFHLGVLTFVLYWFFYMFYNFFHKKYFPYRNIKFDILIVVFISLFAYLYLLGTVASLIRAYIMSLFALILHRSNIKIFSFYTLFIIVGIIISIFPSLIFSLSLWLSVFGVFYIFLFIKYFSRLNKYFLFLFFNIWIYLSLSPIIFYIFEIASIHQLYSPLFSIAFSLFYPLAIFLHIINQGNLLDDILLVWLKTDIKSFDIVLSQYFIMLYFIVSLLSIRYLYAFWLLNIMMVGTFIYFLGYLIQ